MLCERQHRYNEEFNRLPDNQKINEGRHKCAGCAYDQGFNDARIGNPHNLRTNELDESQAGTGRHKSVRAAYDLGYNAGLYH